ncbi:MAG: hypothetical protein OCD76_18055 [Reichenbachiella sp.]
MRFYILLFSFFLSYQFIFAQEATPSFFPKVIETKKGKIVVYQPQSESLSGDKLETRVAISIKYNEDPHPTFGVMWVTNYLEVDRSTRMVKLKSAKVNDVRFPENIDSNKIEEFKKFLESEIPKWSLEFPLDALISTLEEVDGQENINFQNIAPEIIFRTAPAVLIMIDGEPKTKEIEKNYEQIVNTPSFILKKGKKHYLYGGNKWLKSKKGLIDGEWKKMKNPPTNLTYLERKFNKNKSEDVAMKKDEEIPEIIVATGPTELIVTEGEMALVPVPNSGLLYAENTEDDVFMDVELQQYYLLISGRWFAAPALSGPWNYIDPNDLSQEFKNIPEESPKGDVLASVPGTVAAREAMLDANIPQTAAIDRKLAAASVVYDGEPQFVAVEGTSLLYAVNTASAVFLSNGVYFLCDNAVWFHSNTPTGPWTASDVRPVDIDKVPSSNPNYNVKYVYIYESTPEVIYVGYTPGYVGCFAYGPVVVYGTGFHYMAWYGAYYYPRPVTYGYSMRYSTYGGWSVSIHGGYGGYHGHGGYYGPPHYRPPYYRPPHHRPPSHRPPSNRPPTGGQRPPTNGGGRPSTRPSTQPSNRPSTRPATGGGNIYNTRKDVRPSTGSGTRPSTQPSTRPSTGSGTRPSRQPSTRPSTSDRSRPTQPATRPSNGSNNRMNNDVYSDKQGNVHKKSNDGWQQRDNNQWSQPQQRPSNSNMDNSYQNRQRGQQKSNSYQQRPSSQPRNQPSTRPSNGGGGRPAGGGGGSRGRR